MSREDYEVFDILKAERRQAGISNRELSREHYPAARVMAESAGLELVRHNETHFKLRKLGPSGWYVELYPGNQRVYRPPVSGCPFLKLHRPWTLLDAVEAGIAAEQKRQRLAAALQPGDGT